MRLKYTISATAYSSSRFGPCEICKLHVSHVHMQTKFGRFETDSQDSTEVRAVPYAHKGTSFGHESCLIGARS